MIKDLNMGNPEILKYYANNSWNGMPAMVSPLGVVADSEGRKIVKAGTIMGGTTNPWKEKRNEPVTKKNGAGAEGVLLWDVDVTDGADVGTLIVEGVVNLANLPEAPDPAAIAELPNVQFSK